MRQHPAVKGIKIALFVIVGAGVFGFLVKSLWNVLMPPIFGWHTITFWQGLGLFFLARSSLAVSIVTATAAAIAGITA